MPRLLVRAVMVGFLAVLTGCAGSGGSVVAEFELDPCSDAILVPATCRGQDYVLLLDTGASVCVFDRSVGDQLGDPIGRDYVMTHSGVEAVDLYRAPPFVVGGRPLDADEPVICQDLMMLQMALGHNVSGVLGMSFLEDYALQLDADGGTVRLMESPVTDTLRSGSPIALKIEPYSMPIVSVDLGDTTDWSTGLDTGCAYFGAIQYEFCEDLLDKGLLRDAGSVGSITPHRSVSSDVVVADRMVFGPFTHAGAAFGRGESSVLGLPFLLGYNVTLDLPARVGYFERRSTMTNEGYDSSLGASLYYARDGVVVSAVDSAGQVGASGVLPGDVLVAINEKPLVPVPIPCLQELFHGTAADSFRLTFARGDDKLTAVVVPRRNGVESEALE